MKNSVIFGERISEEERIEQGLEYHWKSLYNGRAFRDPRQRPDTLKGHRSIIILPGNDTTSEKEANGYCKRVDAILQAAGVTPEEMPHIYGLAYWKTTDDEHRKKVYSDLNATSFGQELKASDNPGEVSKYCEIFFQEYILPLLVKEDGSPNDFKTSKENLQNITFVSHCHGSVFAYQIEKMLAEKAKEFYGKRAEELMQSVRMLHFASRYPIGHSLGARQFHIVSQMDNSYSDNFVAYDNIHEMMHKMPLNGEVALISEDENEMTLLMKQFRSSSEEKGDDHSIPLLVFGGLDKKPSKENKKAIELTQQLLRHFVLHPEDVRPIQEVLASFDSEWTQKFGQIGEEFKKTVKEQVKTDKSILSLLTDLDGVKIGKVSQGFLTQRGEDGQFVYDALLKKYLKTLRHEDLIAFMKKIGNLIPRERIIEGIKYAIKNKDWVLLGAYIDCAPSSTSVSHIKMNELFEEFKNVPIMALVPAIKKFSFERKEDSVVFLERILKQAEKIQRTSQRLRVLNLVQQKEKEILESLQQWDRAALGSLFKKSSKAQVKNFKTLLSDVRHKQAVELVQVMRTRDKDAPGLTIREMKEYFNLLSQWPTITIQDYQEFLAQHKQFPGLVFDQFMKEKRTRQNQNSGHITKIVDAKNL